MFIDTIEEPQEGQEPITLNKEILPNNVIILEGGSDKFLKNRIKEMSEEKLNGTHYNEESMNRRLLSYHTKNESEKGDLSLNDFFEQNGVESSILNCTNSEGELINKMKIFFERNGKLNNYMTQDFKDIEIESKMLQGDIDKINERNIEIAKAYIIL